jgi:hypothetical protein
MADAEAIPLANMVNFLTIFRLSAERFGGLTVDAKTREDMR